MRNSSRRPKTNVRRSRRDHLLAGPPRRHVSNRLVSRVRRRRPRLVNGASVRRRRSPRPRQHPAGRQGLRHRHRGIESLHGTATVTAKDALLVTGSNTAATRRAVVELPPRRDRRLVAPLDRFLRPTPTLGQGRAVALRPVLGVPFPMRTPSRPP